MAERSIGEQVRAFREARGWSAARMAEACGTTRQNIEHLESRPGLQPRYIAALARVMGTDVETLVAGRYEVNSGSTVATLPGLAISAEARPTPKLSPQAAQLAALFDRLPEDLVIRARAWSSASAAILAFLVDHPP